MIIKKIVLVNFQIHKKLSIELTDGFNCIKGSNQRGKSSLVRAIDWFLTNAPAGDWMCRRDIEGKVHTAIVKLYLDTGDILKRVKGNGRNYYALNEQEFNDIGRNVPVEILNALQTGNESMKALGLNLNIEMQEDHPYLVYETSTTKSGSLNVLTGVNVIEKTIKEFNRDRMEKSRQINYLEEEMTSQIDELVKYDALEDISFDKCDALAAEILRKTAAIETLKKLQCEYQEKLLVVKRYEYLKGVVKDFTIIEQLIVDVKAGRETLDWLQSMAKRIKAYRKFIEPPPFDFDRLDKGLDELTHLQDNLDYFRTIKQRLSQARQACEVGKHTMMVLGKKMIGKICPTCGSKIKKICHG